MQNKKYVKICTQQDQGTKHLGTVGLHFEILIGGRCGIWADVLQETMKHCPEGTTAEYDKVCPGFVFPFQYWYGEVGQYGYHTLPSYSLKDAGNLLRTNIMTLLKERTGFVYYRVILIALRFRVLASFISQEDGPYLHQAIKSAGLWGTLARVVHRKILQPLKIPLSLLEKLVTITALVTLTGESANLAKRIEHQTADASLHGRHIQKLIPFLKDMKRVREFDRHRRSICSKGYVYRIDSPTKIYPQSVNANQASQARQPLSEEHKPLSEEEMNYLNMHVYDAAESSCLACLVCFVVAFRSWEMVPLTIEDSTSVLVVCENPLSQAMIDKFNFEFEQFVKEHIPNFHLSAFFKEL